MFKKVFKKPIITKLMVLLLILFNLSYMDNDAEAKELSVTASAGYFNHYVWRGMNLSNKSVYQPSIDIGFGNASFNIWGNYDTDTSNMNEVDYTFNYSLEKTNYTLDFGYIFYSLDGVDNTEEVYFGISYHSFLNPSFTVYYDFELGEGGFAIASISHSYELSDKSSLNIGSSISFNLNNKVMGFDESGKEFSGLYNGDVTVSLSHQLNPKLSIEPIIAWSTSLSGKADNAIASVSLDGDNSIFYAGINFSYSF